MPEKTYLGHPLDSSVRSGVHSVAIRIVFLASFELLVQLKKRDVSSDAVSLQADASLLTHSIARRYAASSRAYSVP